MYHLKNHMEEVVERLVAKYIREGDCCHCEKCRLDVMALALNTLKPVYIVTRTGEMFASIDSTYPQNQVDAEIAVLKAIALVKANPKH